MSIPRWIVLIGLFIVLGTNLNYSQWIKTNSPYYKANYYAFAVSGTNLFAGTMGVVVFLSANNGISWTHLNARPVSVFSLVLGGSNLFAGTSSGGVFLSTSSGSTWSALSPGWRLSSY